MGVEGGEYKLNKKKKRERVVKYHKVKKKKIIEEILTLSEEGFVEEEKSFSDLNKKV